MSTSTSAHPNVLAFERLATLRATPSQAPALGGELADLGSLESWPERTERFLPFLDAAIQRKEHIGLLASIWGSARAEQVTALRLVSSLMDVRHSGLELVRDLIRPLQAVRICARVARGEQDAATPDPIVQSTRILGLRIGVSAAMLAHRPVDAVRAFHARALALLQQLLHTDVREVELAWLRELCQTEIRARAARLERLAESVGAYDGRRISRLLPYLSRHEERIRDARAIVEQWPHTDALRRRTLVLGELLEQRHLDALLQELAAEPATRELSHLLKLVRHNTPLGADVMFAAAVLRYVDTETRARGDRLLDAARCLLLALQFGGPTAQLHLQLRPAEIRAVRWLVETLRLGASGSVLHVVHDAGRHAPYVSADGVPALLTASKPVQDIREVVLANVRNEHVLCGFLQSPQVASAPGLVEAVVRRTRSIKVLLEIANRKMLYTGYANRNVPAALLAHPNPIPVSALRKFVHVRFVDRGELIAMSQRSARVRPEVRQMITGYLNSLASH